MEHFIIGKIINTHGVHGELKVLPLTDDINRFKKLKCVLIEKNNNLTEYNVSAVKFFNNFVLLKIEGINDLNTAQNYKECYLKIHRSEAVKLPKDSYYICDLIGLKVYTIEEEYLGEVVDVLQNGGNDLYIVEKDTKQIMIPAVKEFVKLIDIENKKMTVKLIEGLTELWK